ncbi:hypothetical protein KBD08_01165 [Candidatus Babeliales bacterium]|nr:hypothetical protein [Candidatus Babeliales bacterium]
MIIQMIVLLCLHFSYFLCAYHNDEPTFHVHGTIGRDIDTLHNDATHNSEPNSLVHVVQSNTRPMSQSEYNQLCKQAVEFDAYCKMTYGMNARSLEHCMYQKPEAFIADLLSRDYLPDVAVLELLAMYKYRHGYEGKKEHKIAHLVKKVQQELQNREKQRLAAYTVQPQQLVQSQKSIQPTQQESAQKQAHNIKSLEQKYSSSMLCHSSYGSSYHNDRQHALQHTQAQSYAKTEQTHELDAQTAGMLEAHGIDSKKFQSLSGTVFQHQLFKECADHYKKAAIAVFEQGLKNSGIVAHVIEITNVAFASTQQESCAWAVTLSDIAEVLADTSLSLCKGLIESGCSTLEIICNPKQLVGAMTRGMQFLGGALAAYDQQPTVGVVHLQACQQAFADDVVLFNQMCDLSKKHFIEWCHNSSDQEKIQEVVKLVTDFTITPWVVGKTVNVIGRIFCEAQSLVKFGRIVDLAEELGLGFEQAQELLYATQEGLQQVPTTVAEVETVVTSLIESEGLFIELQSEVAVVIEEVIEIDVISKTIQELKQTAIVQCEIDTLRLLEKNLEIAQSRSLKSIRMRKLSDGRIRYYSAETPALKVGPTRGSAYVAEYDYRRGVVRGWYESYDYIGNVNRVHPKMLNGKQVDSLHYPHTKKELEMLAHKN